MTGVAPILVICPGCNVEHPHDRPCCVFDDSPAQLRIAQLEQQARHDRATLRALGMVAGCRETERARHRSEVYDLERRIDQLRTQIADMLATFTDRDTPACGSPRARSRWVDARTLRQWRDQIAHTEPGDQG